MKFCFILVRDSEKVFPLGELNSIFRDYNVKVVPSWGITVLH